MRGMFIRFGLTVGLRHPATLNDAAVAAPGRGRKVTPAALLCCGLDFSELFLDVGVAGLGFAAVERRQSRQIFAVEGEVEDVSILYLPTYV